jgi:pyridoxal phosphate enzyme (YggS family)
MIDVAANYRKVLDSIAEATAKSRRAAGQVKLLAATKSQSIELILAAVDAGITLIGENYVQEAAGKKPLITAAIEWHMIGHLQRNKVKAAVDLFDVFESLDNLPLARELDKEGQKRNKVIRVFVEVNLGGEESKTGVNESEAASLVQQVASLSHLRVEGFMSVPPYREDPEEVRPYFRKLRLLQEKLGEIRSPRLELRELSMGMSHDYKVAIEEGASIVRIGTALFGARRD